MKERFCMSHRTLWLLLMLLLDTLSLSQAKRGDTTSIKINEPRVSNQNYGGFNGGSQSNGGQNGYHYGGTAGLRTPNAPESGKEIVNPQVFAALKTANKCTETTKERYRYRVCLFDKVTQHQSWNSWTLGVWKGFHRCDQQLCLGFTDGQRCGNGLPRETEVIVKCPESSSSSSNPQSNTLVLSDISEPVTCHYRMHLSIPALCNFESLFADGHESNVSSSAGTTGLDARTMQWLNDSISDIKEHQSLEQSFRLCMLQLLNYSKPSPNQESLISDEESSNNTDSVGASNTNSSSSLLNFEKSSDDHCAAYFVALDSQQKRAKQRSEQRNQKKKEEDSKNEQSANESRNDGSNQSAENEGDDGMGEEIDMKDGLKWLMDRDEDEDEEDGDIEEWKEHLKEMGYSQDELDGMSDEEIEDLMDRVDFADVDF